MLKALIQKYLKLKYDKTNISGFTLLELLVSIIMASIIVGTLFGFLVNILERDRNEQAKVETQEEIQAALNFIADDVTDAVFIYDADGLYKVGTDGQTVAGQLPHNQTNKGACGTDLTGAGLAISRCTPVLVFWKRFRYDKDREIENPVGTDITVKDLEKTNTSVSIGGDKYVFSLVAYYLIKGSTTDTTWSNSSRILRWEAKSGLPSSCPTQVNCPAILTVTGDTKTYSILPSQGFDRFNLGTNEALADSFNRWRKNPSAQYNFGNLKTSAPYDELIDFIDDTPYFATQDDAAIGNSPLDARVDINIIKNTIPNFGAIPPLPSKNTSCDNPDIGVGTGLNAAQLIDPGRTVFTQRVPPDFADVPANRSQLSSFYACVNSSRISARVYIRGNALARLRDNRNSRKVSDGVFEGFLPTANVRVFGRGIIDNSNQ